MPTSGHILAELNTTEQQLLSLLNIDVTEIFSTMIGMDISASPTMSAADSRFDNCLSAMICLSGKYNGVVSIHTPHPEAMDITSRMLGMEITEVDADVTDALGEIANMIGGSFKNHIVKPGHIVRVNPPTVIVRNEHFRPPDPTEKPDPLTSVLALLFETDKDPFIVTVHLELWE